MYQASKSRKLISFNKRLKITTRFSSIAHTPLLHFYFTIIGGFRMCPCTVVLRRKEDIFLFLLLFFCWGGKVLLRDSSKLTMVIYPCKIKNIFQFYIMNIFAFQREILFVISCIMYVICLSQSFKVDNKKNQQIQSFPFSLEHASTDISFPTPICWSY